MSSAAWGGGGAAGVSGVVTARKWWGVSGVVMTKGERAMARGCEWGWGEVWCEYVGVTFNCLGFL